MSQSDSDEADDLDDLIVGVAASAPVAYIDHYRVIKRIGTGGMGDVYRVEDTELGRHIALKLIRPMPLSNNEARAKQEIKILKSLNHDNIVRLLGDGISQAGETYFTMELIDGMSLAELLSECGGRCSTVRELLAPIAPTSLVGGPMSDISDGSPAYVGAIRIVQQVAMALNYLQAKGITHRDVKPPNIMVQPNGRALLTDLGIAHLPCNSTSINLTNDESFIGTDHYAAPEQHVGEDVDQRTDVYGLGAVLYELICGVRLFPTIINKRKLTSVVQTQCPKAPILRAPHIPRALNAAILKALHKDPAMRFPTALAFAEALQEFIVPKPLKFMEKVSNQAWWIIQVFFLMGFAMSGGAFAAMYFQDKLLQLNWQHPFLPAIIPLCGALALGVVIAGAWYLMCLIWHLLCRFWTWLHRPKLVKS